VSAGNNRVGELLLVRGSDDPVFSRSDDRLLSAVATQIGVAVERARLQREATEAEILRRTDELKTALLNAVSHDLRTPLSSIIASAGSLRQRDVNWTDEERQEFAEAIEHEAMRLNQIVGNLLDLSRMEGGTLRPEKGWYDLGALVDDVLGRLKPFTSRHRIIVDVPDDLPPVLLDYVEIDQVLSNLIENAMKYTAPGTEIRISAQQTNGLMQVEVTDRGPGIPRSALPYLFEPFYRVSDQGPRPKGTGLGLAVAKGLVEAHGGRILVENRPEGGARFVFTLPMEEPTLKGPNENSPGNAAGPTSSPEDKL
jgi:two-component system sensor histidine kinase KdpD